jgi:predicted MFS family arabinose efflux permease
MTDTLNSNNESDEVSIATTVAAVYVFVIGAAVFLVLPIFVGALIDFVGLDDGQAGIVVSAELCGTAVMSIWSFFWIKTWNWRSTVIFMAILLTAVELLSIFATSFLPLIVVRFAAGMAASALLVIPIAWIARLPHSARIFAYAVAAEAALQVIGVSTLPRVLNRFGIEGLYVSLAVLAAIAIAVAFVFMPRSPARKSEDASIAKKFFVRSSIAPMLALLGTAVYWTNIGSIWAFIERMGHAGALSDTVIGDSLAISLVIGVGGALLASWLSDKHGQLLPLGISQLGQVAALLLLLLLPITHATFLVSIIIYNFCWNFALPYQMAVVARVDFAQRFVVWIIAAQSIGDAIGPGIAGQLTDGRNYDGVVVLAVCCLVASMFLFRSVFAKSIQV